MNQRNNFNLLRLVFATAVVYSHSFALLGLPEPILWGRTLGNLSVHGFFVVSGYLISNSYVEFPNLAAFSWNRFLRIVPGLLVALFASHIAADLCNHFATNPVQYIGNGPVWTLTWEVICYIGVAVLGLMAVLTSNGFPVLFAGAWIIYLTNLGNVSNFYGAIVPMFMMFAAGAFIRMANVNLRRSVIPAAILLLFSYGLSTSKPALNLIHSNIVFLWGPHITDEDVRRVAYLAALPLAVLYLGRELPVLAKIKDDISYGVYVYGWPVAQTLIFLGLQHGVKLPPAAFFLLDMSITAPLAWFSWRLIERPAMRLKIKPAKKLAPIFPIQTPPSINPRGANEGAPSHRAAAEH